MNGKEKLLLKMFRGVSDSCPTITHDMLQRGTTAASLASRTVFLSPDNTHQHSLSRAAPKYSYLNRRCHNYWDGQKEFGFAERSIQDIKEDNFNFQQLIDTSMKDFDQLSQEDPSFALLRPEKVVFLVCFSQTRHNRGVGATFLSIVQKTIHTLHSPMFSSSRILRVVPLFFGLKYDLPHVLSTLELEKEECGVYPDAGLYSIQVFLQFLSACQTEKKKSNSPHLTRFQVLLFSEGWLHPRTVASVNSHSECSMTVFPGLVTESLSPRETQAYAEYSACLLRKR